MMTFIQMPKLEYFDRLNNENLRDLDRQNNLTLSILSVTNLLELKQDEIDYRISLCNQLHRRLKQYYPKCELIIFGSTVNGFGFRGSDLDLLFLPFPGYCNTDFKDCEDAFIPFPYRILRGHYPKKDLLKMNEKCHLLFVRKVLYTIRDLFESIIFIPAKCPILNIKFSHFDFECDLSASNRMVVCNSELLRLFGNLDPRVRPLLVLLRYWAKSLGFIQKSLLSSYTFSLMVIFSLQATEPPLLPSVKSLMETAGFSHQIDGWETAFTTNLSGILSSKNTDTIEQLLIHFFDFYWDFDFIKCVVSPYHGRPMSVAELKLAVDERIRDFPVTSFSVQDPFYLCRNVSRNASMKTAFKFALLIAKEVILKEKFSFRQFFDSEFYQKRMDSLYAPTVQHLPEDYLVSTICLTHEIISKLGLSSRTQLNFWYEKASSIVLDVLQYGLLIECEVIDKISWDCESIKYPPRKKKKISARWDQEPTKPSLDTVGDLNLIMSIQCTAYVDTWNSRKKLSKENETVSSEISEDDEIDFPDALKNEFAISKKLVPEAHVITKPPNIWFICNCYKFPSSQIPDILITFFPLTSSFGSIGISTFLKSFVPKTVEKVLKDI